MPYYQLLISGQLLIWQEHTVINGTNPLQDNNPKIMKTWYLNPSLPVVEYRAERKRIMDEVNAIQHPPERGENDVSKE